MYLSLQKISVLEKLESITPHQGIGPLQFGMNKEEIRAILGDPTEIEKVSDEDDLYNGELWHYDEIEVSLAFDEDSDWELFEMSVASPEISIEGRLKVGMTLAELEAEIKALDYDEYETEFLEVNNTEEVYLLELVSKNVLFWFEEGKVCEIQFAV